MSGYKPDHDGGTGFRLNDDSGLKRHLRVSAWNPSWLNYMGFSFDCRRVKSPVFVSSQFLNLILFPCGDTLHHLDSLLMRAKHFCALTTAESWAKY